MLGYSRLNHRDERRHAQESDGQGSLRKGDAGSAGALVFLASCGRLLGGIGRSAGGSVAKILRSVLIIAKRIISNRIISRGFVNTHSVEVSLVEVGLEVEVPVVEVAVPVAEVEAPVAELEVGEGETVATGP